MSREIKFRAWCKNNKYMYEVCSLRFISDKISTNDNVSCLGKEILMQYTGLKDNNGIEIYEGDIIRGKWFLGQYRYNVGIIRKLDKITCINNETFFSWTIEWIKNPPFKIKYSKINGNINSFEIVGNIHENSELLEKGK